MTRTSRRTFLEQSLLAAAAASAPVAPAFALPGRKRSPNDRIQVGVVGIRGRGRAHIGAFKNSPDSEVVAICDPDEGIIGPAQKSVPDAKYYRDLREMLADESIDAIAIATPNHWHSLATIWSLQAGKHVYVEKPLSHNVFEGRQAVNAARAAGKIVQHGTQARSQPATRDAIEWMQGGGLGEVKLAYGLCYKRRGSIGKVDGPQDPPATCDYDLWTGPAPLVPLQRKNLHYDWHWVFDTGNGDLGNQGVHQVDIARWGLGLDRHPEKITSCGGRVGYVDDGNTPNTQVSLLDYGDKQVVFEVRGLQTGDYKGARIGVVFHGEAGYLVSASYEHVKAFDNEGNLIKEFRGSANHFQNFLDAVKADDPGLLNAPVLDGHLSSAMCHLGNISCNLGEERPLADIEAPYGTSEAGADAYGRMLAHLEANGLSAGDTRIHVGPNLRFDVAAERFSGPQAAAANGMLTREYRDPFIVPDLS